MTPTPGRVGRAPERPSQHQQLHELFHQLQQSERWPEPQLKQLEAANVRRLLEHCYNTVPWYAEHLSSIRKRSKSWPQPGTREWQELPVLRRADVLRHANALRSTALPAEHGYVTTTKTSGSTGQPVAVQRTGLNRLMWEAITLREHAWHRRNHAMSIAIIRANGPSAPGPRGRKFGGWGIPFDKVWRCGSTFALDMTTDVAVQAAWLRLVRPKYLLTYPTNLRALLDRFSTGPALAVEQVICVGETVSDELREKCAEILGCAVAANYSSQEIGYMALQCPDCGQYHVQSEAVHVEVLDDRDRPCQSGQVGRIVVTDLHNFAMPLVRYEIGDYAEVGIPCAAGRTLPSLRQIIGRRRNMIVHADGRRHWPLTGFAKFNDVAPILQYQFVQHTIQDIEVRLVSDQALSSGQFHELGCIISKSLGGSFRLNMRQIEGPLPKSSGGKFEEFICLVE